MESENEQLLDLNIIQGLKELDDDDSFFKEIIELYNEQYPGIIENIKSSYNSRNLEALSKAAHALKGASLNIGAKELAAVCKTIELNSKNKEEDGLDILISKLDSLYGKTMTEIEKL